jgi:phosphatidylglycerol:prolipoprotein diacylglycerol transferase
LIFPEFDPVLFSIGPLAIRWYALAYIAGILLGWRYAAMLARREALWRPRTPPLGVSQIDDLVLWITLGVIGGGRLGYALFYQPRMFGQIFTGDSLGERLELLQVWTGGMSFHGGLLGVTLALLLFARAQRVNPLSIADLVAPAVPIGLFFGRIANFINGELWGRTADDSVPWAMVFPGAGPLPRHPSQLYEALLEGVLLFIAIWLVANRVPAAKRPGFLTGTFLVGYGLARIVAEFFREPDDFLGFLIGGATMGQLLSVPMVLAGLAFMWLAKPRP